MCRDRCMKPFHADQQLRSVPARALWRSRCQNQNPLYEEEGAWVASTESRPSPRGVEKYFFLTPSLIGLVKSRCNVNCTTEIIGAIRTKSEWWESPTVPSGITVCVQFVSSDRV